MRRYGTVSPAGVSWPAASCVLAAKTGARPQDILARLKEEAGVAWLSRSRAHELVLEHVANEIKDRAFAEQQLETRLQDYDRQVLGRGEEAKDENHQYLRLPLKEAAAPLSRHLRLALDLWDYVPPKALEWT